MYLGSLVDFCETVFHFYFFWNDDVKLRPVPATTRKKQEEEGDFSLIVVSNGGYCSSTVVMKF